MNPPVRNLSPPCVFACLQVLGVRLANSAYHASAISVKHATEQLELLLRDIEALYGIGRRELASSLLYVSHETFTYARNGGCAGAEVTALRAAFGDDLRKVLITNSKGITGHAMGVCFEVRAKSPPMRRRRFANPIRPANPLFTVGTPRNDLVPHMHDAGRGRRCLVELWPRAPDRQLPRK